MNGPNKEACDETFKTEFNNAVEAKMNEEIRRAEAAAGALDDKLKKDGLTTAEATELNSLAAKPREQCEKLTKIEKVKATEESLLGKAADSIIDQLEKEIARAQHKPASVTKAYLDGKKEDFFNKKAKQYIADYAKDNCEKVAGETLLKCLQNLKVAVETNKAATESKLAQLKSTDKPKCKYFPVAATEDMKCKKAGVFLKIRAFFDILKKDNVKACIGLATLREVVGKIVSKVTEAIIDKVFNILGSFIYAGVKIIYFIIKMFHQFWKLGEITSKIKTTDSDAKKIKDTKGKSQALGAALGYGFRVVKSVVEMVGGRKNRRHRRLKF